MKPRVSWMEKVGKEDPQYWERETQASYVQEQASRQGLETLRNRYHQSEGLHMLQGIASCDLQGDGSKRGFLQEAYNGETITSFTMSVSIMEHYIELLEKCLSYGKEMLLRTGLQDTGSHSMEQEGQPLAETPMVTLSSRMEVEDGMEMHVCRVYGFYPREIDASWTRDGEVWLEETFHGSVAPNADGTYHYWLSIRLIPKRDRSVPRGARQPAGASAPGPEG
ncbi:putative MHC class I antigen protein [Naja naja]|nr:putative MHC class I antigen protein [Naja naja]